MLPKPLQAAGTPTETTRMTTAMTDLYSPQLQQAIDALEVALPVAGHGLDQDEEWIVVNTERGWRKIRLHDYDEVYAITGLYEKWVYDIHQCRSPQKVADYLIPAVHAAGVDPAELRVLDLGAGNGYVADVLRTRGCRHFVGVDLYPEARDAADRDRPGLYADYIAGDMTDLSDQQQQTLGQHRLDCLTCVAALGFGDIPPQVFAAAYNYIEDGGWAAFTIKTDFLAGDEPSGFSRLIKRMLGEGVMEVATRQPFVHRVAPDGSELVYEAFIGRKKSDIPADWALGD